ncbi:hypothetical protein SNK05_003567 [Fusarium graminearum]|nr:hypothetical protein FG05_10163 [Fusarium graminearum]
MNSDKRVQSRMARSAISSDPLSTDGSYDIIRSVPSSLRKEYSGDHNAASKFAEAMNNPDWRRRRESCSAYDSIATTSSNTDWVTIGSGESLQLHTNKDVSTCSRSGRSCTWDSINSTNHWRSSLDSSEVSSRDMSEAPIDKDHPSVDRYNMLTAVNKNLGYSAHGLCALLDNSEIIDAPKDVRILKLVPLLPEDGNPQDSGRVIMEHGKSYPIAHIQPARGMLPRWDVSAEAVDERYRKYLSFFSDRSSEERYNTSKSSGVGNIERAREAVYQDPAVTNVGNRIGESQEKAEAPPPFVSNNLRTHELSRRNEAFKKILSRLQAAKTNKSEKVVTERPKEETGQRSEEFQRLLKKLRHQSGSETRHSAEKHNFQPELSKEPDRVPPQRKDISSDPAIVSAYTSYSKKKEWSQDSGVCMDSELNPRAREFLSFKSFERASTSSDDPSISEQELFQQIGLGKGSEESEYLVNQPAEMESTSLNHHMPPMKLDYLSASEQGDTSPETNPIPVGQQGLVGFDHTSNMLPFSNIAFPFGACQTPMQNIAAPELLSGLGLATPIGKWPPITSFGNQLNLPTANLPFQSCAVAPNPLMGINATPQLPYNPTLGSSGYSACPPPVSKPILPDPIQQQKYEAYIEWRKANEPGYALACKSRQQRRAQRGSIPPPPTLGKVQHSEVQPVLIMFLQASLLMNSEISRFIQEWVLLVIRTRDHLVERPPESVGSSGEMLHEVYQVVMRGEIRKPHLWRHYK